MKKSRFEIYRASAGSGKTFLLSIHYLLLVLENPDIFRRILGLTFTNKAAKELKERILFFLGLLAQIPNYQNDGLKASILKSLENEGWNDDEKQTQQKALKALQYILHHYTYFSISTIDAFMYKVVSSFSFDMQIADDFDVELDADILIDEAIHRLLDQVGQEEPITNLLQNILLEMVDDEKGWNIEKEIREMAQIIFLEKSNDPLRDLNGFQPAQIQETSSKVREYSNQIQSCAQRIAHDILNKVESAGLGESNFKGKSNSFLAWVKKFTEENIDIKDISYFKTVQNALEIDEWFTGNNEQDRKMFEPIKEEVKNNLKTLTHLRSEYLLANLVYNSLFRLPLYSDLYRTIEEIKRENNVLHISDFNRLISQHIRSEPVPYIYARLGMRFKHFLLDEFQDTSVMQWHNLVPLLHNALSSSEDGYARIVIVGDGKQSIYRWRNGELEIFENLPKIYRKPDQQNFEEAEYLFSSFTPPDLNILNQNFRSLKNIVEFNQNFFGYLKESLGSEAQKIYQNTQQTTDQNRQGGLVQWEWVSKNDTKEDVDGHLERIYQIIDELLNNANQTYRPNDIAILVRKNIEAQRIADFLIRKNIPVVSPDSLMLNQSDSVRRVISWLKLIAQPDDRLALATAIELNQGMIGVPDASNLLNLNQLRGEQLLEEVFGFNSSNLSFYDLYTLTVCILRSCHLNDPPEVFCMALLEQVKGQNRYKPFSLEDFLDEWDQHQDHWAVNFSENINAIRIMTIHKAKGLEFPVVIRPYLFSRTDYNSTEWVASSKILNDRKNDFWSNFEIPWLYLNSSSKFKDLGIKGLQEFYNEVTEKQLIEDLNLMYVAFTRAKERLYVLAYLPSESDSDSNLLANSSMGVLKEHFGFNDGQVFTYPEDAYRKTGEEKTKREGEMETEKQRDEETKRCGEEEEIVKSGVGENGRMGDGGIEEKVVSTKMNLRHLAPKEWKATSPNTEREWGAMIHLLLSRSHEPEVLKDIPEFRQMTKKMGETFGSALLEKLRILKDDPLYSIVFERDGEKLIEREILLPGGMWLRPDLVVIGKNFTVIIDYKTGQPNTQYIEQMREYIKALSDAGYPAIEAYLVYLENPPHIERVSI